MDSPLFWIALVILGVAGFATVESIVFRYFRSRERQLELKIEVAKAENANQKDTRS